MTNNYEECSSYIALENLRFSVQIYWGCAYLWSKCNKAAWGT